MAHAMLSFYIGISKSALLGVVGDVNIAATLRGWI